MLHIILVILKILGILLLVILGILLAVILAILFVPFGYQVQGQGNLQEKTISGKAGVSWLFYLIYARVRYQQGKTDMEVFVFGIPVIALKRWIGKKLKKLKAKRTPKAERSDKIESKEEIIVSEEESKVKSEVQPEEKIGIKPEHTIETKSEEKSETKPEDKSVEKAVIKKNPVGGILEKIKSIASRIWSFPKKIVRQIRKIRLTFEGFCDKIKQWRMFFQLDTTKSAIRFLKQKGKLLLKHVLPRRVRGNVTFGFDDPALTGQLLAATGILYPLYKGKFQMYPVFDKVTLEGDIKLRGHIVGGFLLWQAWQLYKNKDVKATYQRFQHKEA